MVRQRTIRDMLCKKCQKIIKDYEEKYRKENKDKIKKRRHKYYLKQKEEGKIKTSRENITLKTENLERLKKILDKTPDEEI